MSKQKSEPESSVDDTASSKHHAPDKGWAWVIAFAGTLNVFIGVGFYRSMGMLTVELTEVFDEPAARISLIFTSTAAGFCASAIVYILGIGQIFHERALVLVSGLIGSVGFFLTYFYTRLEGFYISGFCVGIMAQVSMSSSLGIVGKYFHKRLSVANGIVMSGTSSATIILPTVVQLLYDEYTYRGAGIIVAGITLNSFVCVSLMRPARTSKPSIVKGNCETQAPGICSLAQEEHLTYATRQNDSGESGLKGVVEGTVRTCPDLRKAPVGSVSNGAVAKEDAVESPATTDLSTNVTGGNHKVYMMTRHNNNGNCKVNIISGNTCESNQRNGFEKVTKLDFSTTAKVVGVSNSGFATDVSDPDVGHIETENKVRKVPNSSTAFNAFKEFVFVNVEDQPKKGSRLQTVVGGLVLFKTASFNFYQLFVFFSTLACEGLIQFFPAFIADSGTSPYHTAFLLSIIGGSDLVARILLGCLGDYVNRDVLVLVPQMVLALTCFLAKFATETWSQIILAVFIGLNYGTTYSFRGVLLIDYFGLERLSQTLGITNFVGSLGFTVGSPLLGYLRDVTGSYIASLQVLGLVFLSSFVSLLVVMMIKLCGRLKKKSYHVN